MITINMDKAKEIQKNKLRAERAPLLAQLDVEFMRAMESGDAAVLEKISEKKQLLRDVTKHKAILDASSVDELKLVSLDDLLK